jgi:acyl-CoA thioester hydrolase
MKLCYRGSVNRWECDENDHLNVRFYVEKSWQTLVTGLMDLLSDGGDDRLRSAEMLLGEVDMQHIRFLQESRLAAPLSGYLAVVGPHLVLTELRHSFTDEVLCTTLHRIPNLVFENAQIVPEYAAPRGIKDEDLAHIRLSLEEAKAHGFRLIGRGVIRADECAFNGRMHMHHYMARFSDSMPHLWGEFHDHDGEFPPNEGGAVVEYRLRYHGPYLEADQRYELVSGICGVGNKVHHFAHLMFNLETGKVCVSGESVGVRIDLEERRAIGLAPEVQALMQTKLVKQPRVAS